MWGGLYFYIFGFGTESFGAVKKIQQIQTVAKSAGVHRNEWVENADRWVAGFLEMFEEGCHEMGTAIRDQIQVHLLRQQSRNLLSNGKINNNNVEEYYKGYYNEEEEYYDDEDYERSEASSQYRCFLNLLHMHNSISCKNFVTFSRKLYFSIRYMMLILNCMAKF